jgi:hypothetical protein
MQAVDAGKIRPLVLHRPCSRQRRTASKTRRDQARHCATIGRINKRSTNPAKSVIVEEGRRASLRKMEDGMTSNYPRWFLVIGSAYLMTGVMLGMYMGGTGEFRLAPVHAHINLVGFVLMSVFALILRAIPGMVDTILAKAHFWLFQVGAFLLVAALYLLISERAAESTIGPVIFLGEVLVFAGLAAFVVNLYRHA